MTDLPGYVKSDVAALAVCIAAIVILLFKVLV